MSSNEKNLKSVSKKNLWGLSEYKNYIVTALVFTAASGILVIVLGGLIPPVVPFFYGQPAGENQLTSSKGLLIGSGFSVAVIIVNTILASITRDEFLKKVLVGGAFLFSLLMLITIVKIFLLVGFF